MPVRLTTEEDVTGELPLIDEDLRRRIEELASRPNFESKEVQEELRNLVKDALQGHVIDQENGERSVRQRREGDGN